MKNSLDLGGCYPPRPSETCKKKTDIKLVPLMPDEDNAFSEWLFCFGCHNLMTSRAHTLLN